MRTCAAACWGISPPAASTRRSRWWWSSTPPRRDGSVALAEGMGARVHRSRRRTSTRRRGTSACRWRAARSSSSPRQDAYAPRGRLARESSPRPCGAGAVAGAYGRQLAHDGASRSGAVTSSTSSTARPSREQGTAGPPSSRWTRRSSRTSTRRCARTSCGSTPFAEDITMSEHRSGRAASSSTATGSPTSPKGPSCATRTPTRCGAAFKRFFDSGVSSEQGLHGGRRAGRGGAASPRGRLRPRRAQGGSGTATAAPSPTRSSTRGTKFAGLQLGLRRE